MENEKARYDAIPYDAILYPTVQQDATTWIRMHSNMEGQSCRALCHIDVLRCVLHHLRHAQDGHYELVYYKYIERFYVYITEQE